MRTTTGFMARFRGWVQALRYTFAIARSVRVRAVWTLELQFDDDEDIDDACDEIESVLHGWTCRAVDEHRVRLAPPAYMEATR